MSITLNFTPEIETQLYNAAVAANVSPEIYVADIVHQHLQTKPRAPRISPNEAKSLPQINLDLSVDKPSGVDVHYSELIEFLLSHLSLAEIIAFQPPEWVSTRVSELLDKNRAGQLTAQETVELDQYVALNTLMTQLKAKARYKLL